jgi:hypothetical protein
MFEPLFNDKAPITKKRVLTYLISHKKSSKICKFNKQTFKNYSKKAEKKQLQKAHNTSTTSKEKLRVSCRNRRKNIDLASKVDVEEESSTKLSPATRMERPLPYKTSCVR